MKKKVKLQPMWVDVDENTSKEGVKEYVYQRLHHKTPAIEEVVDVDE